VDFKENGVAICSGPAPLERKLLLSAESSMFQCAEGYNSSHILQKCDACHRNPCGGNGWCQSTSFDSFTCHCQPGYYGSRCQQEIDACFGEPCENGGTCSASGGRFECQCRPGFSGYMCEENEDDCVDNKCENGATCVDRIQGYECKCAFGYKGEMCEQSQDLCAEIKPCKNGAECRIQSGDYACDCPVGFTDKNCSTNIDDCIGNICQNGAHCIDGLGEYSCECLLGYSGRYCAIKTQLVPNYVGSSVCQNSDCQNGGVCFQPLRSNEYVCRCPSGYEGKKCEKLQSVRFVEDSYVQAPGLNFSSFQNITITFTTADDKGILFYQGTNSHISVELYQGRVRVHFNPKEAQSHSLIMYSYATVNNSQPHTVSVIVDGPQVSLYVDGGMPREVMSEGSKRHINGISNFYMGGLPADIGARAKYLFHVGRKNSFKGCFHIVYINGKPFDFSSVNLISNQVLPGCQGKSLLKDPCAMNICQHGSCVADYDKMDYKCKCNEGYTGTTCDEIKVSCVARSYKDYYTDPQTGCKSKGKVKLKRCEGDNSCIVKRTKAKSIKFQCDDKSSYIKNIEIPRKCSRVKNRRV